MKKINIFILCLGMIFTFSFLGCKKDASDIEQDQPIKATASGSYYGGAVIIQNSAFNPSELYVREKATVAWVNKDNTVHTVTANDGTFDSGDLLPGGAFSYTFNTRGDYFYYCKYHSEMVGVIKVVDIIK